MSPTVSGWLGTAPLIPLLVGQARWHVFTRWMRLLTPPWRLGLERQRLLGSRPGLRWWTPQWPSRTLRGSRLGAVCTPCFLRVLGRRLLLLLQLVLTGRSLRALLPRSLWPQCLSLQLAQPVRPRALIERLPYLFGYVSTGFSALSSGRGRLQGGGRSPGAPGTAVFLWTTPFERCHALRLVAAPWHWFLGYFGVSGTARSAAALFGGALSSNASAAAAGSATLSAYDCVTGLRG